MSFGRSLSRFSALTYVVIHVVSLSLRSYLRGHVKFGPVYRVDQSRLMFNRKTRVSSRQSVGSQVWC